MIVITCVDDDFGMLFNNRRQSKDSLLRKRILEKTAGHKLWMNDYSAKQFKEDTAPQINVDNDFLLNAAAGDYCFVETQQLRACEKSIEKLILYRWNRKYPSDLKFDLDLSNWRLIETTDFPGNSHETITEEIYENNLSETHR